ncbi:MAG: translational GTPase TypA [Chlamydiia bacterium]|nr:translational GTPase TypA [Chlamydiia bacterium]
MQDPQKIRNVAIIAHIDHGKTTLLDSLLKQTNLFGAHEELPERMLDSYDQEKERGITIFAKHTSFNYNDIKINLIDTPGHADFAGEVERILGMVSSVLLLVDAKEGPMPQTRFVLSKSLEIGLKPIVILNKIDRPGSDPDRVLDETFDLFTELGATDEQLDFRYIYASGLNGYATHHINDPQKDMKPLLDLIVNEVPPPPGELSLPFLMQVATTFYNDFVGRQACGRILQGKVKKKEEVACVDRKGHSKNYRITKIEGHLGLKQIELEEAGTGDIVVLSGIPEVMIGDTLCDKDHIKQLPPIKLEEPTVSIDISINSSPFVGRDGAHVTMNKIRDRLSQEQRANISLKFSNPSQEVVRVAGRGELHLAVLIETMRREHIELSLGKPQVVRKQVDGEWCEPIQRAHVEVPEGCSGAIIEEFARRKGEMQHLETNEFGITKLEYLIPTRGLIGLRNKFLTLTRGQGILTALFHSFERDKGVIPGRARGVLISDRAGKANAYASFTLQDRGILFVAPGDDVYEGMIVGEHTKENDLIVNITKGKKLTNVRAAGSDENLLLSPPRQFTLEEAIDYIDDDELVEVTPHHIRMRKKYLTENERKRNR